MNFYNELQLLAEEMRDRASGWSHGAHPMVTTEYAKEWATRIEAIASRMNPNKTATETLHDLCDCPNGRAEHASWCAAVSGDRQ